MTEGGRLEHRKRLEIWEMLFRDWRHSMTYTEFLIVQFIYARTVLWGKKHEVIPYRHFSEGVFSAAGECVMSPLGLSRSTFYAQIKKLEDRGFVNVRKNIAGRDRHAYALDFEGAKIDTSVKKPIADLQKIGDKVVRPAGHCVRPVGLQSPSSRTPIIIRRNKEMKARTSGADAPRGIQALREKAEGSAEKSAIARDRAKSKAGLDAYGRVWLDTFKACYPDAIAVRWKKKEKGQIRQALSLLPDDIDVKDLFDIVIRHWRSIATARWGWRRIYKPPEYPHVGFFAKNVADFCEAYTGIKRTGVIPLPGGADLRASGRYSGAITASAAAPPARAASGTVLSPAFLPKGGSSDQSMQDLRKQNLLLSKQLDKTTRELENYERAQRAGKGHTDRKIRITTRTAGIKPFRD